MSAKNELGKWLDQKPLLPDIKVQLLGEGIHQLNELGVTVYKNGPVRMAISNGRGGALHLESPKKVQSDLGYTFLNGNRLWGPSDEPVKLEIAGNRPTKLSYPLKARLVKQKAGLIQRAWFSFALRIALGIPIARKIFRTFIYKSAVKKNSSITIGMREISFANNDVDVRDQINPGYNTLRRVYEWNFTDGHATRMYQTPTAIFDRPLELGQ